MPHFVYIGDPKANYSGPPTCEVWGHSFPKNEAVFIEEGELCEKLKKHSHFRRRQGRPPKVKHGDENQA